VPKIIGRGGKNLKDIARACDGKLRLRGKGSRFKEVDTPNGKAEADIPLQLCVSCKCEDDMKVARDLVTGLFDKHAGSFAKFCQQEGTESPKTFYFELPHGVKS
jgi:hypothetical protein